MPLWHSTGAVTVVFGDYFYVEDSNRSNGIRVVKANSGVTAGQLVNIAGTMATLDSGERFVNAGTPVPAGTLQLTPVGLNNKSMGGGNLGDPAAGKGQAGVSDGAGLNNIGLYVKVWGKVSIVGGKYKLNDGSGVDVTIQVVNGTIADGAYISATGIMSCQKDTSGTVTRLLLVKNAATDVRSF